MTHHAVIRGSGRAISVTVCGRVMIDAHPRVRSDFALRAMALPYGPINVFRRYARRFHLIPRGWRPVSEPISETAPHAQQDRDSAPPTEQRAVDNREVPNHSKPEPARAPLRQDMPCFVLKHHKAVWETTTVEVDAPDADHVKEHADEWIVAALENDTAQIASGDTVEGVADEYEVYDECGKCLAGTGPTAARRSERPWRVVYQIHYLGEDDRIDVGRVTVLAPSEADALRKAIAWAHDHDPRCDERIDYRIEAEVDGQETQEDDDDQQDNPAG